MVRKKTYPSAKFDRLLAAYAYALEQVKGFEWDENELHEQDKRAAMEEAEQAYRRLRDYVGTLERTCDQATP